MVQSKFYILKAHKEGAHVQNYFVHIDSFVDCWTFKGKIIIEIYYLLSLTFYIY